MKELATIFINKIQFYAEQAEKSLPAKIVKNIPLYDEYKRAIEKLESESVSLILCILDSNIPDKLTCLVKVYSDCIISFNNVKIESKKEKIRNRSSEFRENHPHFSRDYMARTVKPIIHSICVVTGISYHQGEKVFKCPLVKKFARTHWDWVMEKDKEWKPRTKYITKKRYI